MAPKRLHRVGALVFGALSISLSVHAQAGLTPAAARELDNRLRAVIEEALADATVAVTMVDRGGRPTVVVARGEDRGRKVNEMSAFDVGSVAELFTAVAVQRLAMRGAVRIDDAITQHIVGLPRAFGRLSIRELLHHTSGLPLIDVSSDDVKAADRFVFGATARGVEVPPGRLYRRNPLDYGVLAVIVERAGKKPFEDFVRGSVWAPAKLRDASFAVDPERRWSTLGRGGIRLSARDLHAWFRALLAGRVIDAELLADLTDVEPPEWSLFAVERAGDGTATTLRITDEADRAAVAYHRLQDTLVVVVGDGSVDAAKLMEAVATTLLDRGMSTAVLERFVGRYRLSTREELSVALDGDHLVLRSLGQTVSARLRHGQPQMPEWPRFYEEAEDRLAILIRPLLERDLDSFARGFHAGAPAQAAEQAMAMLASLEQQHGRIGKHRVIGTTAQGGTKSYIRVPFGEHAVTICAVWHGQELESVRLAEQEWPFEIALVPESDDEFAASTLDGKKRIRVRFRGAAKKPARTLVLYDESKSGRRGLKATRMR